MNLELTDLIIFFIIVPILLIIDLKLFNKGEDHVIGFRKSLILSAWYIVAGLAYGLVVWSHFGPERATLYYTTYIIEKSLSHYTADFLGPLNFKRLKWNRLGRGFV